MSPSVFTIHVCIPFAYISQTKSNEQHWFSNVISVSSCLLLSVRKDSALRVKTKALWCGISALNIMTLRGSGGSYGKGLFLVCSHMKCHQEFDKIWRSNPLWELRWTAHFLILFSCYNRALTGYPCHCVIKLIICRKNYFRLCCLEVRKSGRLLMLLNWLFFVSGQECARR